MGKSRLELLEEIGLRAYEAGGASPNKALIHAVAAMLNEAIKKPARALTAKGVEDLKLPFGPGQLFDALEKHCSDLIQLRPYETGSFGRLGKSMARIQGLELADLDRLINWLTEGRGLSTWTCTVTWTHVCKHLPTWIMYARAYADKGSQAAGGSSEFRWK
jgi:hypothetical protein